MPSAGVDFRILLYFIAGAHGSAPLYISRDDCFSLYGVLRNRISGRRKLVIRKALDFRTDFAGGEPNGVPERICWRKAARQRF